MKYEGFIFGGEVLNYERHLIEKLKHRFYEVGKSLAIIAALQCKFHLCHQCHKDLGFIDHLGFIIKIIDFNNMLFLL